MSNAPDFLRSDESLRAEAKEIKAIISALFELAVTERPGAVEARAIIAETRACPEEDEERGQALIARAKLLLALTED